MLDNNARRARSLRALASRLQTQTLEMLTAEVERLAEENESLRSRLAWAEDCAEAWHDDAMAALSERADAEGGALALTRSGRVVVVSAAQGMHA